MLLINMDGTLLCNIKKCRKTLSSGQVWVTSCSHLFCSEDGENFLAQQKKCPVCDHELRGKLDIVRVDLNPSEAYKSMVLCGLHPDVIMDISSRAINFWIFQSRQEYLFTEHLLIKSRDKYAKLEKLSNKMAVDWQHEVKAMRCDLQKTKHDLDSFKKRCEELNELLRDKTRQLQKLQSSYSAHRQSALQMKMVQSPMVSPGRCQRMKEDEMENGRPKFSAFDIPFGASLQPSPPEKENNFETAFRFNVDSIPASPMTRSRPESTFR